MQDDSRQLTDAERASKWRTIQALAWLCIDAAGHDIQIRKAGTDHETTDKRSN